MRSRQDVFFNLTCLLDYYKSCSRVKRLKQI